MREHRLRRHPGARHVGRAAARRAAVEGVLHRRGVAGVDEQPGHVGPAHRGARALTACAPAAAPGRSARRPGPAPRRSPRRARRGGPAARLEEGGEGRLRGRRSSSRARGRRGRATPPSPRCRARSVRPCAPARGRRLGVAGDGVVVGHREHAHAGGVHPPHQLRRTAPAVGGGRVQVQVDHVVGRVLRAAARPRPRPADARRACPACRRVMSARYSRISSSRCSRSSSANSRKICLPSESSNRSP